MKKNIFLYQKLNKMEKFLAACVFQKPIFSSQTHNFNEFIYFYFIFYSWVYLTTTLFLSIIMLILKYLRINAVYIVGLIITKINNTLEGPNQATNKSNT